MTDEKGAGEGGSDAAGGMRVEADLVRQLAALLNENDLSEIEVEDGDRRIVVKRQIALAPVLPAPAYAPAAGTAAASAPGTPPAAAEEVSAANHPGALKSPMVGTVYLQASPEAPAFIKSGDTVKKGQTLLIIEAMKTMNPIQAPRDGVVADILVGDAQPVEYGEPLVLLES